MKPFSLPTHLQFIQLNDLNAQLIKTASRHKTALFILENTSDQLSLLPMIETMKQQGPLTLIHQIPTRLSVKNITSALRTLRDSDYTLIIAIGGGSVLELAKSVAALIWMNDQDLDEAKVLKAIQHHTYQKHTSRPELIAVPTTFGSGSELSSWATVWDIENSATYTLETPSLIFDRAYISVEASLSMPLRLTLSTGLDALTQATEAYWAISSSPAIQTLALKAIRLIVRNLPQVLRNLDSVDLRKQMMHGSILASMAYSNTLPNACHSIAVPLALKFELDLGLACAMSLPDLLRHNLGALSNPESVYEAFNINNPEELWAWIEKTAEGIASMKLSDYGVKSEDLEELASLSFSLGKMDQNPIELTPKHIENILKLHL
jgi:alcohol dehydrogenase class IV